MTTLLAWRNLLHDPIRFAATLIGIIFSVTLMAIQGSLLVGFSSTASGLVDHSAADIWIASRGTKNVDQSVTLSDKYYYKALQLAGIDEVSRLVVRYVNWRKSDGGSELVIVVGFDPYSTLAGPWNIAEGDRVTLVDPNAVMIDRLYLRKLGIGQIGQTVEINGRKARITGLTDGIRTFTQSPYVFTSYNNALKYTDVQDSYANYVLVRAKDPSRVDDLAREIAATIPDVDVMTTRQFSAKTQNYWIYTTGAGSSLALGSVLGAIVGIVIVAQTLYAATMERLSEYATLAAMGAGHGYLNRIVVKQALIAGVLGFGLGMGIALGIISFLSKGPAAMILPAYVIGLIGLFTLTMCVISSVLAIRKLMSIDPTSVFR